MQRKLIHKYIIGILFFSVIFGCKGDTPKGDVEYGRTIYMKYCISCHGKMTEFGNAPAFIRFTRLDSTTILKKLSDVSDDSVHLSLKSIPYSSKEILSLYLYIRDLSTLRY